MYKAMLNLFKHLHKIIKMILPKSTSKYKYLYTVSKSIYFIMCKEKYIIYILLYDILFSIYVFRFMVESLNNFYFRLTEI